MAEAQELFDFSINEAVKYPNLQVVICPPFVYLEELAKLLNVKRSTLNANLGAQDLFWEKSGPYTSEIFVDMVREFGVTHVLVGHSDRRYKMNETDEVINKKIKAALETGIIPVLFVGERNRGDDRRQILEQQLTVDLAGLTPDQIGKILIAYEPVWAISTTPGSEPDTPKNTLEALQIIQEFLGFRFQVSGFRFLYGGSIDSKNVADFLKHPEISGAVIGGASLRKNEFAEIIRLVSRL